MNFEINIPEVVAEVAEAHRRYERALSANDVDVLNSRFGTVSIPCSTVATEPW